MVVAGAAGVLSAAAESSAIFVARARDGGLVGGAGVVVLMAGLGGGCRERSGGGRYLDALLPADFARLLAGSGSLRPKDRRMSSSSSAGVLRLGARVETRVLESVAQLLERAGAVGGILWRCGVAGEAGCLGGSTC